MNKSLGTVIVTGGTRNIGKASTLRLADLGYDIILTWNSSKNKAAEVVKKINSKGVMAKAIQLQLDTNNIKETFKEIDQWLPSPIVGLVNNVGIDGGRAHFSKKSTKDWKDLFQVNLFSLVEICKEVYKRMAISKGGNGGSIVNVSSQVALFGGINLTPYSASKGAVNSFTISLAKELGPEGIRVNAVSPGLINNTENLEKQNEKIDQIPLGRRGEPSDVAELIAWLISNRSSFISGTIIPVHGAR
jgi:NAD(P)-dependent dehydrogenase (short-subunit alcohol dehydrogenase family)